MGRVGRWGWWPLLLACRPGTGLDGDLPDRRAGSLGEGFDPPEVVRVFAGDGFSCQLDDESWLACFGFESEADALSFGRVTDVDLGRIQTCSLDLAGTLMCSGTDTDYRVTPFGEPGRLDVGAGDWLTCVVEADHTISCWGMDSAILGVGTLAGTYDSVSVGPYYGCAIQNETQKAHCWGYGPLRTLKGLWSQIDVGRYHICGLDLDGLAVCMGSLPLPPAGPFNQISTGAYTTCGRRESGAIECWGEDTEPGGLLEPPPGTYVDVAVGNQHACALDTRGAVVCWGDNTYGQLEAPDRWW